MTQSTAPQGLRLFIAIELTDAWKQGLARLQDDMRRALAADESVSRIKVRWVKPESMHLTLKFLGNVVPERLEKIHWALDSAIPKGLEFDMRLVQAGSFSGRHAPSVIWASIHFEATERSAVPVHALVDSIDTWLAAAGFARERRRFAPHLTLARLPQDLNAEARIKAAAITTSVQVPSLAPLHVEHVSLMRSHPGPGGARYDCLASFPR